MIHPLLSPRLYFQHLEKNKPERPLSLMRERRRHPMRDYAAQTARAIYLRCGSALGFIAGLTLAIWALYPTSNG